MEELGVKVEELGVKVEELRLGFQLVSERVGNLENLAKHILEQVKGLATDVEKSNTITRTCSEILLATMATV